VSENRYLPTLCALFVSGILVSSMLLLLQAATSWNSPRMRSEAYGRNSQNSHPRYAHVQVKLVESTNRAQEAAPLPEPTVRSSSSAEPIHTASITGQAELDAGVPASFSSPESEPTPPHRDPSLTGVAGETTDKSPRTDVSPKEKLDGGAFTPELSTEAEARKQVEISEPTEPNSDDVGGDLDEGTASVEHAPDAGSSASRSKTPTLLAVPAESKEKPSAKPAAYAAKKQEHRPPIPQAKPRRKPMTLAPSETPARPSSKAKRSAKPVAYAAKKQEHRPPIRRAKPRRKPMTLAPN
jgi:hypothetical protein